MALMIRPDISCYVAVVPFNHGLNSICNGEYVSAISYVIGKDEEKNDLPKLLELVVSNCVFISGNRPIVL
ncbi:hypothetical protein BH09BAC4_BH09BAC4_21800 [soil metagenome]